MNKRIIYLAALLLLSAAARAQVTEAYIKAISKAEAFFKAKQYLESANTFTEAFAANDGNGLRDDRYNAACAWALAGNNDSAFNQLNRIATKSKFSDYVLLTKDPDLNSLYTDKRWATICRLIQQNKTQFEANLNKPLVAALKTIFKDDQDDRVRMPDCENKYGYSSKEVNSLWQTIEYKDSVNLIKVTAILDKYGWLGPNVVGIQGNTTLFLIIQHSDIKVQEKYLPMMREAVKNNNATAGDLALLEDRVALRQGRKQIYGSQIHGDPNGHPWVSPLEDPDNVDKRRASVGLGPLAEYTKLFDIKWDVEAYKKQLPELERLEGMK